MDKALSGPVEPMPIGTAVRSKERNRYRLIGVIGGVAMTIIVFVVTLVIVGAVSAVQNNSDLFWPTWLPSGLVAVALAPFAGYIFTRLLMWGLDAVMDDVVGGF